MFQFLYLKYKMFKYTFSVLNNCFIYLFYLSHKLKHTHI